MPDMSVADPLIEETTTPETFPTVSEVRPEVSFFEGLIVHLADKSQWEIMEPLSEPKYQDVIAPCEATQVFTCICVEDPQGAWTEVPEAVVKVKYQYVQRYG